MKKTMMQFLTVKIVDVTAHVCGVLAPRPHINEGRCFPKSFSLSGRKFQKVYQISAILCFSDIKKIMIPLLTVKIIHVAVYVGNEEC